MVSSREREVAAEHFARDLLGAVRTRRAHGGRFQDEDLMGADVWARLDDGSTALVQETKADTRLADKRRGLEQLGGDELEPIADHERRIVVLWESIPDPDDGRRRIHRFDIHELGSARIDDVDEDAGRIESDRLGDIVLAFDGRSRRPDDVHVWARWPDPVVIDRSTWYDAGACDDA